METLESYKDDLTNTGLAGALVTIDKLIDAAKSDETEWGKVVDLCEELRGRLIDEAQSKLFFSLSLRETDLYQNPRKGWESAVARFNTIGDDVEEAQKCFALSRYAAAVFHSVQIAEAGLIELGKFLKVTDPLSGWAAVSKALNKVIVKDHKSRTRFERKHFAFLEQLQGTVEGLKNAWRNKISHTQGRLVLMTTDFSPEITEEILLATRNFMRRLAENLPPPKMTKK